MSSLRSEFWKLAELGYNRSAKKCKEKFENIYKYHKRTKEERAAKHDGKAYRFSNELEALGNHSHLPLLSSEKLQIPMVNSVTSVTPTNTLQISTNPSPVQHISSCDFMVTTSSSRSSLGQNSDDKKRKWSSFFENLLEEVVRKQEIFHIKFLKRMEQLEHERMAREETWKRQEMERVNRENEILVKEQSAAAIRNATVIAFLEKISKQPFDTLQLSERSLLLLSDSSLAVEKIVNSPELDNAQNYFQKCYSRWPKAEVQALITIRTDLERGYQGNIPKGSMWEEISAAMKKLGCYRSAKRCKEKWENINKYFKKVKESNKMRPENSKTCPYFHQLEALYKEKMDKIISSLNPSYGLNAEDLVMHMIRRSKQPRQEHIGLISATEYLGSDNDDQYYEKEDENVSNDPCSMPIAE